jgi:CheY-like chemotaxis protein
MAKILVVDNEENALLLYKRELTDEGYEVMTAANAREALERVRSDRPDLVVLDIRMPGMDGLEVLPRMLSIDRRLPILLNSAYPYYWDNFLSWSADDFIIKSSDLSALKCAIKSRLPGRVDGPIPCPSPAERVWSAI